MTLLGSMRARRMRDALDARLRSMEGADAARAATTQLDLLNREWARIRTDVPFYARLVAEERAPRAFDSLEQFARTLPPTRRADLGADLSERTSRSRTADFFRTTGGTTAEPVQIPAWTEEREHTAPDLWVGRGWYGITPASRLFLLWGHSHLLGTGWRGRVNALRRRASDRLLGYHRFSAYHLTPDALREAGRRIAALRPDYLLGYSVALDLLARANADRRDALRAAGLRLVVGAAEGFPSPESVAAIEDLFGAPVGMEYGSVETDLMAHTHPAGGYRVFWRSYLFEAEEVSPGGGRIVRVTSLFPRCMPLVRYEIGDEVDLFADQPAGIVTRFAAVRGRCNAFVELDDGARIHSEAFTHAVRDCAGVAAYQVAQEPLELRLLARSDLHAPALDEIRRRLGIVHPALRDMRIVPVSELEQTIAGKSPMILKRSRGG